MEQQYTLRLERIEAELERWLPENQSLLSAEAIEELLPIAGEPLKKEAEYDGAYGADALTYYLHP